MASKKKIKSYKGKQKNNKSFRKIGLAKFIPSTNEKIKSRNKDDKHETNLVENKDKTKDKMVKSLKSEQKNMSLIDRCKLQMSSSLLRLIDEDLYTSESGNVSVDKERFEAYHDAYASVCDKWPTKPIDFIVKFIKKRFLVKQHIRYKFADIGCGMEPKLKMKLPPRYKVLSFDLVSKHKDIIEANMESLPAADESINCAVYSLSLMAKNLGTVILEGKRILKVGGSMLIVEVTSRFEGNEKRFIGKLDRLGLKKKSSQTLKPNGYFTFFHFAKIDSRLDYSPSYKNIELKPCIYKAR